MESNELEKTIGSNVTDGSDQSGLRLNCVIDTVLDYAMVHNGFDIIRDISLENPSSVDFCHLMIRISSDSQLIQQEKFGVDIIKPDEVLHFRNIHLVINADMLASLTEKCICPLHVEVFAEQNMLASQVFNVTILAFDQWPGVQYTPELLAAFVMPNHPVINSLIQLTAQYLEQWTQDPSLAGYQYNDPNRVKNMAAAAYAAIQQMNIIYAEPPASFEECGQRIRLPDAVLEQRLGTCMDITLLYAACLEAIGLNPILVMMKGHIFAGVWLKEDSFSETVMDDPSQLEKRMSRGIHELLVVECTAMCAGKRNGFDEAILLAETNVANYQDFVFVIDVKRSRSMGIHPLPVRTKADNGFVVEHTDRSQKDITDAPEHIGDTYVMSDFSGKEPVTKISQWERKLLDLSLRNMLINMRLTKSVVPLLASDVGILEDALSDGEEFHVLPRPKEMSLTGNGVISIETLGQLGTFTDFITLEIQHKRLHSLYTDAELSSCLNKMYRSAKTSLEENGASTLYLALGVLRWLESRESTSARFAPIVLIPIDITRKSASKGYALRMRDEDSQINITLLEFLKQNYDIHISGLNPPPMDEHGLNIYKILSLIHI